MAQAQIDEISVSLVDMIKFDVYGLVMKSTDTVLNLRLKAKELCKRPMTIFKVIDRKRHELTVDDETIASVISFCRRGNFIIFFNYPFGRE